MSQHQPQDTESNRNNEKANVERKHPPNSINFSSLKKKVLWSRHCLAKFFSYPYMYIRILRSAQPYVYLRAQVSIARKSTMTTLCRSRQQT